MADDDSPLISGARSLYKTANDLVNKIPTPGYKSGDEESDYVKQMNKQMQDKGVQDATKSFATQTPAQKRVVPTKTTVKVKTSGPTKQMPGGK